MKLSFEKDHLMNGINIVLKAVPSKTTMPILECILIDARDIAAGPVCRIALPHKISSGTHSHWADRSVLRQFS